MSGSRRGSSAESRMSADELSRRELLGAAAAMTGGLGIPSSGWAKTLLSSRPPNIIFIMADDLGVADLSCYGRRDYRTPAIDRLAEEGVRFTHAYANSASCSPTRVALMTGRYQYRLAVGLEEPLSTKGKHGLPPTHPTLPSLLKNLGYKTVLLGKWHLGNLPEFGPLQSGYDHFWGFRNGAADYFYHDLNGKHDLWDDDREVFEKGYLTDLLGEKAVEFLSDYARSEAPFFMSLHFNAPHFPWEGPNDEAEARRLRSGRFSLSHYDGGSLKTYDEMVVRMDMQVGRLVEALERLGLKENTMIIFTSDNGGERYSDTWPHTGKKLELLEGGLRVPAIASWPNHIEPGSVSDQVIITMDWMPTLLSIAGGAPRPDYPADGLDITGALLGTAPVQPRTLCWRYYNMAQEACREGDWKYLKILGNSFLFNVLEDPLERANLKNKNPAMFEHLRTRYKQWESQMLPIDPTVNTAGHKGEEWADHFGIEDRRTVPAHND